MSFVEWSLRGVEMMNCNCDYGCPCQFNGDPSHGDCRAFIFVQVEEGRFGATSLDGLRWGGIFSWPGAIHEGNGTSQAVIHERATPEQRAALEAIAQGRETETGRLIWQIFSATVTTVLPTLFRAIDLTIDVDARQAKLSVPELLESEIAPIPNENFAEGHRARVHLPNGFEFTEAEFASGRTRGGGDLQLNFDGTHAHLSRIHWSTHGVVR